MGVEVQVKVQAEVQVQHLWFLELEKSHWSGSSSGSRLFSSDSTLGEVRHALYIYTLHHTLCTLHSPPHLELEMQSFFPPTLAWSRKLRT